MAKTLTFLLLLVSTSVYGQKFMIVGKDTLPFKSKMAVSYDTTYKEKIAYVKADTTYEEVCYSFEIIDKKIVNQTDDNCRRLGLWIIKDSTGNCETGMYNDNRQIGVWKNFYFDKAKRLTKELHSVYLGNDEYTVEQIDYHEGKVTISNKHPIIALLAIINEPFHTFFIHNFGPVLIAFILLLFLRYALNNGIYNSENGTDFSAFGNRFVLTAFDPIKFKHQLKCLFTIWFSRYHPGNRHGAILSNILSIFWLASLLLFVIEGMVLNLKPVF